MWAQSTAVQVGELGEMTFVVVKDELDGEKPSIKYLLCSTPRVGAQEIIHRYKTRWVIEIWFENLKQYAGARAYRGRNLKGDRNGTSYCVLCPSVDCDRFSDAWYISECT